MKWLTWLTIIVFVVFIPVALLAAFALPNAYSIQGIEGGIDCDGPIKVMMFAIPCFLVYGVGVIVLLLTYLRTRKILNLVGTILFCGILLAITPNVIAALSEHNKNITVNVSTCGKGW